MIPAILHSTLSILVVLGFAYGVSYPLKYDISYEVYLTHMIIVNIFVQLEYIGSYTSFVFVVVITVTLSVAMEWLNRIVLSKVQ